MKRIAKTLSCLLPLALIVSSLILIQLGSAQSPSRPAIPNFTLALTTHSYDLPNSTNITIDQGTGKTQVETIPGYHVENKTIDIMIPNQPHTAQAKQNYNLYYDLRVKTHSETNWKALYNHNSESNNLPIATFTDYTIISVSQDYPNDALVDFQVEAINGSQLGEQLGGWQYQESGWSDIHTLSVANGSVSITPYISPESTQQPIPARTPTPSILPTASEFPKEAFLILAVIVFLALAAMFWRRRRRLTVQTMSLAKRT